jgi:hypothetical protein
MKEPTTASRLQTSRIVLAFLLGLAIVGPLLLSNASSAGVPEWVGGVIPVAALLPPRRPWAGSYADTPNSSYLDSPLRSSAGGL